MRATTSLLFLVLGVAACSESGSPGSPHYLATMTVINRTTAEIDVWSGEGGQRSFNVPACGETTQANFPVNWWWLSSPNRNTFHSGGGVSSSWSYVVVTDVPNQTAARPAVIPPCAGLLQAP